MTQHENETSTENNIWLRGLFMILFGILYSLAGTVLLVVAVLQFILVLLGSAPNTRLLSFGRSLGSYVQQVVSFQIFNTRGKAFSFLRLADVTATCITTFHWINPHPNLPPERGKELFC